MGAFINDLKYRYKVATMPMKIIYINIVIFLLLRIAGIVCFFAGIHPSSFLRFVELPSSFAMLASYPWTIITYMFAQYDILHILFNMLVLYWFGRLFLEAFTPKQFVALYIIGGIGGALLYMLSAMVLPVYQGISGSLIGASASVMAIVIAIAIKIPHYRVGLLFFGMVSLKWIAIAYVAIDFLSITGDNSGGHIAHLGGAACGALFTLLINRGTDITRPINRIIDVILSAFNSFTYFFTKAKSAKKKPAASASHHNSSSQNSSSSRTGMSKEDEAILDSILDKIKKSGYASLTEDEKRRLFQVSTKKQ